MDRALEHGADGAPPRRLAGARRYVTVLFSDVSNSSQHAEQLEAEAYAALLEQFRLHARRIIPRHGGSIARLQGDGVLALFGHDTPREDDGRRATQAALELHAAVARLRIGLQPDAGTLQLHTGIHAGLVLLLEGDIERGRYDVVGEVPNTAARLCSLAGSGDILVSAETLGPQAHFFRVAPSRRMALRGRAAPLDVLRVLGRAQVGRRIDAGAQRGVTPLVGRADALAELQQAARDSALPTAGEAVVVHVSGEPGVGKTRLIDEFQRGLDRNEFLVLRGYCESYLAAEPLQPFLGGLRALLGWNDPPTAAPHAEPHAVEPAATESLARGLLGRRRGAARRSEADSPAPRRLSAAARVEAIGELLGRLAGPRTLVLLLDDWQWADDASRQVLHALLARRGLALLAVLAARSGEVDDDAVLRRARALPLQPLDSRAGESAVVARLPEADAFLVQEIVRQSGGSPLFIEELCHAAAAGGDVPAEPGVRGAAWIGALVASRLARLPHALAEALQLASVIGNVVPAALLERVAGPGAAPLQVLLGAQDLLVATDQPGILRFKHVLTRDAVYATVDAEQRRAWHLRVAQTLDADGDEEQTFDSLEALSYHYDAAQRSEQAAHFAVEAGDKAFAAMALDRARAHYLIALRSLDALPALSRAMQLQWCAVAQKLGPTCVFDPLDMAEASPMFERALEFARATGDIDAIARAEYWMAYVSYGRGRPREAVRHGEAALRHATAAGDERLVAQVQATLGQSLASAGQYPRALPMLVEAVESKRQQSRPGSGTAIGSAYSVARIAYSLGDLGRFGEARQRFEEALALLGDSTHLVRASVDELICAVHLWQGHWAAARQAGLAGADIALRCRSRYLTAMGRALAGCGAWALDGDEAALRSLRDNTHWIDVRGGAVSTSLNHGWLVEAAVTLGRADEARQHAQRLFQRARLHDRHGLGMGCRALARLAGLQGDRRGARHYLALAERAAAQRDSPRERALNQLAQGEVALALEAPAEARACLDAAAEALARMDMAWHLRRASALATSA
jgi:class 3 adenylate cyclase/tetratricopeptide (TPR) repeat protein